MKTKAMRRASVGSVVLILALLPACRRDADDRGVGTSSVGAGGDNGAAPNNTGKAEPVPGTKDAAQQQSGDPAPTGRDQPAVPATEEQRSADRK